jgi:hypothetical protein
MTACFSAMIKIALMRLLTESKIAEWIYQWISTVCLGKIKAKLLKALLASHFNLILGVPVNIGFNGSGLNTCLTSIYVLKSSFGGRFELLGSPCAGFQLKDIASECTYKMRGRDLHHLDRPCFTTVIPDCNLASKSLYRFVVSSVERSGYGGGSPAFHVMWCCPSVVLKLICG